jgi:hypothetical protein
MRHDLHDRTGGARRHRLQHTISADAEPLGDGGLRDARRRAQIDTRCPRSDDGAVPNGPTVAANWRTCVIVVPVVMLQMPWRSMKLIGTAPNAARYSTARFEAHSGLASDVAPCPPATDGHAYRDATVSPFFSRLRFRREGLT